MFTDFNELEELAREFAEFTAKVKVDLTELDSKHAEMMSKVGREKL